MPDKVKVIDEINKTVEMLPQSLGDDVLKRFTRENKCFDNNFIVYKCSSVADPLTGMRKQMVECHCTACDSVFYADKVAANICNNCNSVIGFINSENNEIIHSGSYTMCPWCGVGVKALHTSVMGRYAYHVADAYCATVHNVNGHLVLLTWTVEQDLDRNARITYAVRRREGIVLIKNKAYRVTGKQRYFYNAEMYFNKWVLRKRYDEQIEKVIRDFIYCEKWDLVYETDSQNCALREYISGGECCYPGAYLRVWSEYNNVENLVKQGYVKILNSAIDKCYSSSYYYAKKTFSISGISINLNLKKAKPHEIFDIDKTELPLAKQYDICKLAFYRFIKDTKGICLNDELITAAEKLGFSKLTRFFTEAHESGYVPPVVKTINYLIKQRKDTQYLTDYWNILYDVYNTMPPDLIFPKNLMKSHDKILTLYKERENRILSDKIRRCAEKNAALCFSDDETGLFIRPAKNQKELINEGEQLHHCVATYAKSVAKGDTLILFIRKMDNPDTSYFTLELKDGIVQQNRGIRNCDRTDDVVIFEAKWLEFLKTLKRKEVKQCVKL